MSEPKQRHNDDVFRDKIEAFRDPYYVTYHPAQSGSPAIINVVYPQAAAPEIVVVKRVMQTELECWCDRYGIPSMVMAFAGDDRIPLGSDDCEYLVGYLKNGVLQQEWRGYESPELSIRYPTTEELATVYHDLPFRCRGEVREKATREMVSQARGVKGIVFLIVGFPVLIEIAAWGITWLGHLMAAVSIALGFRRLSRTMGWLKPSARDIAKNEEEQQMRHHHYHCVRNPQAFQALMAENLKRELAAREQAEYERIRAASGTKVPGS